MGIADPLSDVKEETRMGVDWSSSIKGSQQIHKQ